MIRHNSEIDQDELVLYRSKPGIMGETIMDTVVFDDPETFQQAIKQLKKIGTVVVSGTGEIRHQHHLWNHTENSEDWFDKNEDESTWGRISCVLRVKNGILAPCEPKIVKASSS
jgi:hypothetical protein